MSVFDSLSQAERARQLANPEGEVGLAVAEWMVEVNRQANGRIVRLLGIEPGNQVLEIGFGSGRTAPEVVAQAEGVRYAGIDISQTMVDEANRFNADLVTTGRASFHLGSAEQMPFAAGTFDRAFSLGVVHFWAEPVEPLREVHRVMRPGGLSLMGCLHPKSVPDFAKGDHGFYLRDAEAWEAVYRSAGFADPKAEEIVAELTAPDGSPVTRVTFLIAARA